MTWDANGSPVEGDVLRRERLTDDERAQLRAEFERDFAQTRRAILNGPTYAFTECDCHECDECVLIDSLRATFTANIITWP